MSAACYNDLMSPTVFREAGYRFFFFSREEARPHVHVVSGTGEAKFWLEPEIRPARNYHYSRHELRNIASIIEVHHHELLRARQERFGS
jgi:hypothetical protein